MGVISVDQTDGLIKRIEELRLDLIRIKVGRAYTDPEVVSASQRLDDVLNEYQKLRILNESDYLMNQQS
ncbi:MAG TPA: aspartyl-phosphate phosphatase Spo0E family protein [Desulfosporosinus sp.]|nr:aspartyl-phosphate phosphatase Spo0E family protein [Desulfosporosinus sp.]